MKKLILIFFVFNYINCFPQAFPLKITISDSIHSDSVCFGLHNNATIGVDTLLGEMNIIENKKDSIDIRSIQRDEYNYNCLTQTWNNNPIYAPENLDLKIDYRPLAWGGDFNTLNNNFEFSIESKFSPYTISGDFSNIGAYYFGSRILLLDSVCNSIAEVYPERFQTNQIIGTIRDTNKYFLLVHLEHEVGIENTSDYQSIDIFPNPTKDFVAIEGLSDRMGEIIINDISGKILITKKINNEDFIQIDLNELETGIYLIKITNLKDKGILEKLIIKQ